MTLQGSQITDVAALQMPDRPPALRARSARRPRRCCEQEVLQAQSAQIDIVSGATYTSQSYAQSLQCALDRAPG